jgi:hypothetical protein
VGKIRGCIFFTEDREVHEEGPEGRSPRRNFASFANFCREKFEAASFLQKIAKFTKRDLKEIPA